MKGHSKANCNKLLKYDFCHLTGHIKDECYRLTGYLIDFKGEKKTNDVIGLMVSNNYMFDPNTTVSVHAFQMMPYFQKGGFLQYYNPYQHSQ